MQEITPSVLGFGTTMSAGSILTLREVAKRLAQIRRLPSGKIAVPELLRLLRSGELKAGFEFPGTTVRWIPIPTSYWTAVSSAKFGSLRYIEGDKKKTGTYEVRIYDFVDEYMEVLSHNQQGTTSDTTAEMLRDELKKALCAAPRPYEVGITAEEWTAYLKRNQLSDAEPSQRSVAGRREKTSWSHLAPIIAGCMMIQYKRYSGSSSDQLAIATAIIEIAHKEEVPDLPAPDTLRDVISKAFARAEALSKQ
jgi:hypothetical protein